MKLNLGFPLLIASALIINGCAFSKDDKSKKDQNPVTIQQVPQPKELGDSVTAQDMQLIMQPREQLHEYDVIVKWPENKRAKIFLDGLRQRFSLEGVQANSAIFICRKAEPFSIHIRTYAYGAEAPNEFDIESRCITDLSIDNTGGFNPFPESKTHFGRLVFKDRSSINLDGKSLDLEVDQLLIEGTAEIRTYHAPGATKSEADINKPPTISIKAKKAGAYGTAQAGQIEFHMIGLNGNQGRSGDDLEKLNPEFQEERQRNRKGDNAQEGDGMRFWKQFAGPDVKPGGVGKFGFGPPCDDPPGNGGDGEPGADGHPGEIGQTGMDAPKLTLQVESAEDFVANIYLVPGRGGPGGHGGRAIPGGEGGDGYIPFKPDPKCPKGQQGKQGPDGKTGPNGPQGKTGVATKPEVSPNIKSFTHER